MMDENDATFFKLLTEALDELTATVIIKNRYRDALRFIANHTAEPDTALATVVNFARLTLEEAQP